MAVEIRIPNIKNYTQTIINGDLILTPAQKYITEEELYKLPFKSSSINTCIIKKNNNIISNNISNLTIIKYFRLVLIDIWKTMPTQKILQTSTFNFKLTQENGYIWYPEINMFVQNENTEKTIKEIINMIKINKMSMELSIRLNTHTMEFFKI